MVNTIEDVRRVVQTVMQSHPNVASVAVFGSFARGEQTLASDLDLIITKKPSAHLGFEFCVIIDELEQLSGRKVDLLFQSTVKSLDFAENIMKESRCIYGESVELPKTHDGAHQRH